MQHLWDYTFKEKLKIDPKDHKVRYLYIPLTIMHFHGSPLLCTLVPGIILLHFSFLLSLLSNHPPYIDPSHRAPFKSSP